MTIDLYCSMNSPASRSVLMTAKHLGVNVNIKPINLREGENKTEAYLKMNPVHTVPTIDDKGFFLWESRAIMTYLVNTYAPGNNLYPTDPKKRALVDKMLYFDMGTLGQSFWDYFVPQIREKKPADPEKEEKMKTALGYLENFLKKQQYVALDHVTLADIAIIASITACEAFGYDLSSFTNIQNWTKRLQEELPYYKEVNEEAVAKLREYVKNELGR